ncbi:MAG: FAD-binding oxidoreductase [Rhodoferax sp.]|nr:FAD-binding oxidoreductase [Rhodoferax sp.]
MAIALKAADGGVVQVSPEILQAFKANFAGAVVTSEDVAFDETRTIWDGLIDRRPSLIVRCSGTADIVQAVRFARQHQFLMSVRGSGHNIAGLAVCDGGLMIDLSLMRGVWVDPVARTARAQAGCTLGNLDRETQLHGLAAVLGFVSTTGVADLTVGGGFGYLTRQYGWTCDNLVSMELVTADGALVRAAADENADLFWALRGSGHFGIVTSFEYRLFPVGPEILGGAMAWRAEDAKDVLDFYRQFTATAPRETTCVAVLRIAPPAPWLPKEIHGKPIIAIFVCHSGSIEAGEAAMAPLRKLGRAVADSVKRRPYTQMQSLLDATQPQGRRYDWKSHYLARIDAQAVDVLIAHAKQMCSPFSAIVLFHLQGALAELPAEHSPAGHRDAAYVLNITSAWESADDDAANLRWARDCFEAMQGFSTGGTDINFPTEEEGCQHTEATCGKPTLARLAALKQKYDPDHLFQATKSSAACAWVAPK